MLVWCDGAILPAEEATVSVVDRTVLYGLGAFETVRLHGGRPFRLDRHLRRLRRSLESVDLELPEVAAALVAGLPELAERCGVAAGLARITVTAGVEGGSRGRVTALCEALPARLPGPVAVGVVPSPHAASPLLGVKSTSYLANYLLRSRAQAAGRVDDLLMESHGHITDATTSNVFVVCDGELALSCRERPLERAELAEVDECFLTSSVKGVLVVQELDGRTMPAEHPMADALSAALVARAADECGVKTTDVIF
jgi:branched-chain amino acid aminotransferase